MYKPVSMRRTATALVAGVAVFFSGLVATPAYAQNATDNANITITELTVSNDAQNGADETLTVWDNATFNAKWKAENGVKNGEKFTVKYPAEFQVYASQDFKLVDKNGTDGGDCKVVSDEQTIECTFNKEFEGRDNVEGTLSCPARALALANLTTACPKTSLSSGGTPSRATRATGSSTCPARTWPNPTRIPSTLKMN